MFAIPALSQNETVTDSKGRKIVLKADKTWEFQPVISEPAVTVGKEIIKPDSVGTIAKILNDNEITLKKSEFETESEYLKRLATLLTNTKNPATGKSLDQSVFAFSGVAQYDAENQEFKFSPWMTRFQDDKTSAAIRFVKRGKFGNWDEVLSITAPNFKSSPDSAKAIKPDLVLLVWASPVEVSRFRFNLLVKKTAAYNTRTGEIYAVKDNTSATEFAPLTQ